MYNKLTNRVRALKSTSGLLSPGPLREFRTASDERAGPGNEAIHAPFLEDGVVLVQLVLLQNV